MQFLSTLPIMARRYRIRSVKDLIAVIVIGVVLYGVQSLCIKKFDMEPSTARVVGFFAALVVAFILVFSFH